LQRWLRYVDMSEAEFDRTSDTFRDPRVWSIVDGRWKKSDIWGGEGDYGPVFLADGDLERWTRRAAQLKVSHG
jgi:hypothetical protein